MTALELRAWLRGRYPKEDVRHEWKEWASLKQNISGRKGEDLVSYVSALANMEGGCIVIGAQDRTLAVTGIRDFADYTAENVVHRILGKTPALPSMGLWVEVLQASDTSAVVWLVHVPRHAPRQPVHAHDKAWQRDGDSLAELRADRLQAILSEPLAGHDWSAAVVQGAGPADLDSHALATARRNYAKRYASKPWAPEIPGWSDATFLDRVKLAFNGGITRAALLLLGRPECVHWLSPAVAEMSWKVPEERAIEHFGPPFLLATTQVLQRIRNPNIKLFPATRLLAEEMAKYETRVILEALHNCVAHQDYERGARIVVEEHRGYLVFRSAGGFFDGEPEQYLDGTRTPTRYRNKCLAAAMVELDMIDTAGYGIRDMYSTQRRRFLPLPDYDGTMAQEVVLKVYGQVIDENYSKLLMERSDLPLEHVLWLDRIQKKQKIDDAQIAELRKARLIEGRKPHWHVSASIAAATGAQSEYILNRGFGDDYYKRLMLERLDKFGPASGRQLRDLVWDKLPHALSRQARETKVKNLRTALRLRGLDGKLIEIDPAGPARGPNAIWRIKRPDGVV